MAELIINVDIDSLMEGVTNPDTNYGASNGLGVGAIVVAGEKAFLYRAIGNFDVSALSGEVINSAKLECYVYSTAGGSFAASVYRCTRPATWTEGGVTWNKYDGINAWTAGGGDYDAGTPPPVAFATRVPVGWMTITGMKGFVDDALSLRSDVVSLILKADDEDPAATETCTWYQKDFGSNIWRLVVTYGEVAARRVLTAEY